MAFIWRLQPEPYNVCFHQLLFTSRVGSFHHSTESNRHHPLILDLSAHSQMSPPKLLPIYQSPEGEGNTTHIASFTNFTTLDPTNSSSIVSKPQSPMDPQFIGFPTHTLSVKPESQPRLCLSTWAPWELLFCQQRRSLRYLVLKG